MRRVKPGMGCVIPVLIVVGICVGIYKVVLWCERRPELTTGIAIGLVIGGLVAFVAGNVWASLLLKKGGEIGARRAEAETKVDVAKIRAAIQAMRTFGGQQQEPQMPMVRPPQAQGWLPEYPVDGEFRYYDERSRQNEPTSD